ncbi:hypothetical protein IFM89_038930 [Coptis chinensis]|uniref:Protein kinase domain-containing protein n=1 Tax=Coptis chinensis TaxID=261450 RepID=A0A835I9R5_9MAGN|nr:hypothetical protein IFM89_038930 [Coptis chinensis]
MKCFHFSNGEKRDDRNNNEDGTSFSAVSRFSKVSWARSLSVASKGIGTAVRSESDYYSNTSTGTSRDLLSDSAAFHDFLSQRRANHLRIFAFSELKSATRGFSRGLMIGEGGFGCVYKGVVAVSADDAASAPSKMDVAVKQLNRNGLQATSNILLDEDFNAKLSDFGLARQGPSEGLGHVSTSVVGTVGYAAPEYVQTGRLTTKSDVWSFGVVLYELITGRRSVDRNLPRNEQKLLEWVKPYVSGPKRIHVIMDPLLEGRYCRKSAQKLVGLANKCLMKQPNSRPKMSEVVEILGQIISETASSSDVAVSQPIEEVETAKQKEDNVLNTDSTKQGSSYRRVVFDLKEIVSLRNRSSGRLDWRNWAPVVRTW